jgi:hypothetical protein
MVSLSQRVVVSLSQLLVVLVGVLLWLSQLLVVRLVDVQIWVYLWLWQQHLGVRLGVLLWLSQLLVVRLGDVPLSVAPVFSVVLSGDLSLWVDLWLSVLSVHCLRPVVWRRVQILVWGARFSSRLPVLVVVPSLLLLLWVLVVEPLL